MGASAGDPPPAQCQRLGCNGWDPVCILGDDVSEAWGREATQMFVCYHGTQLNACQAGCFRGAEVHRALLSFSLRQLNSNEGALAKSIIAHQKALEV